VSEADRAKWNARYRDGAYAARTHPSVLLAQWPARLPPGRALDVACGAGRNSLFLAAAGREVDAVDISAAALERARRTAAERGLEVRWIEADLEEDPAAALPAGPYAVIVHVRYVNPRLLPCLLERLGRGGVLLCEQHVESAEDVAGPRNPAFRLRRNELLRDAMTAAGPERDVLFYQEGLVTDPDGRRVALAQLVLERR
jgi:tellurite methyltransferase